MVGEESHDVNNEFVILVFPVTTYLSPAPLAMGITKTFSTSLTDHVGNNCYAGFIK